MDASAVMKQRVLTLAAETAALSAETSTYRELLGTTPYDARRGVIPNGLHERIDTVGRSIENLSRDFVNPDVRHALGLAGSDLQRQAQLLRESNAMGLPLMTPSMIDVATFATRQAVRAAFSIEDPKVFTGAALTWTDTRP